MRNLKNKRILITAGPTWVAIDKVRVLSNIATGETGILLAKTLSRLGAKVTVILGPCGVCSLDKKIKVLRFNYFNEFKKTLFKELKSFKYDCLIHSAAVSDYYPKKTNKGKISSNLKHLNIELKPLPKIINSIKSRATGIKLVGFKFEPFIGKTELISKANILMKKSSCDIVVANSNSPYRAFIIDKGRKIISVKNKEQLVDKLIKIL